MAADVDCRESPEMCTFGDVGPSGGGWECRQIICKGEAFLSKTKRKKPETTKLVNIQWNTGLSLWSQTCQFLFILTPEQPTNQTTISAQCRAECWLFCGHFSAFFEHQTVFGWFLGTVAEL